MTSSRGRTHDQGWLRSAEWSAASAPSCTEPGRTGRNIGDAVLEAFDALVRSAGGRKKCQSHLMASDARDWATPSVRVDKICLPFYASPLLRQDSSPTFEAARARWARARAGAMDRWRDGLARSKVGDQLRGHALRTPDGQPAEARRWPCQRTGVWPLRRQALSFAAAAVILSFAVAAFPAHTVAASPSLTANPTSSPPGGVVGLHGDGFPGKTPVTITWDGSTAGMPVAKTRPNGTFDVNLTVPAQATDGSHTIAASAGGASAGATLQVVSATPTATPTAAGASSLTATPTPAAASTPTATGTVSVVPTLTSTLTQTPIPAATPTQTPTPTNPPSATVTPTATATPPPSATPTSSPYGATVLADGPVAYWRLGETSGTAYKDSTGHTSDATLNSQANATQGILGAIVNDGDKALRWNSASPYLRVPHNAVLNLGNVLSVEAWVKPSDLNARRTIYSTRLANAAGGFSLDVGPADGTQPGSVTVATPGWYNVITANNVVGTDRWYHVVYVRSGTAVGQQKVYVNGVEVGLAVDSPTAMATSSPCAPITVEAENGALISGAQASFLVATESEGPTHIYQNSDTSGTDTPSSGGRAAYSFSLSCGGDYVINGVISSASAGENSVYVDFDTEPINGPTMLWDTPISAGFVQTTATWRGNGTPDMAQ